jgi:hypothetical protein
MPPMAGTLMIPRKYSLLASGNVFQDPDAFRETRFRVRAL